MVETIKLSAPATRGFWEIPVLFEDEWLLALAKPANLLCSSSPTEVDRPSLTQLLHAGITAQKPWAQQRGLSFLGLARRLDFEVGGVVLFAKSQAVLAELANLFGTEKPADDYLALVVGTPEADQFEVTVKIAPDPLRPELSRVDARQGRKSKTRFEVVEKFAGYTLLRCRPLTWREHQIRVHLKSVRLPVVGDPSYGGKPLWLSRLKKDYRLKPGRTERPLISQPALYSTQLHLPHPVTQQPLLVTAPQPKDLRVALRYLREFRGGQTP